MLIAELTIDHPIFAEPLRNIPGIELVWEETYGRDEGQIQMLVWIDSDSWDAVEAAIETDPAIRNPNVLTEVDGRRLYRVEFTELGEKTNLMPEYIEVGAVLQSSIGTNEGWEVRVRFPDRAGLEHIYFFCKERDIPIQIDAVYEQRTWTKDAGPILSEPQRQVLVQAFECGYLSIPRECSQSELGRQLGISDTAASERFRRAVRNLVEQTVL